MAACSDDPSAGYGRRGRLPDVDEEIEEGEFVPRSCSYDDTGSDTDTDDEAARYFLRPHYDGGEKEEEDRPRVKRRRLEDIVAGVRDAVPASSTVSSVGSDRTISDVVNAGASAAAVVERAALVFFRCCVCPREFGSRKAVHGHMRVHSQGHEKARKDMEMPAVPVSGGSFKDEVDESMATAIVGAEPKLAVVEDPMPMPAASTNQNVHGNSTTTSSMEHSESMAVVVAPPNPSTKLVVFHPPPPAPQQDVVHPPPAAPQQDVVQTPSTPQQVLVVPPPVEPQQVIVHPPVPLQQVAVHPPSAPQQVIVHPPNGSLQIIAHELAAPPPAGINVRGFSCRECGKWYPTHQGLGGHVAGHKNRREAAAAALAAGGDQVGAVACRGDAKPAKVHVCTKCGQEFPSGVALGGHKRKHYDKRIVPKKRNTGLPLCPGPAAASVGEAPEQAAETMEAMQQHALAPALAPTEPAPATPSVEVAQPAQAPVTRSVRIFGVTIMQSQGPSDEHKSTQE